MTKAPRRTIAIILSVIAVAIVVFIFAQSMMGSAGSWRESNIVAALFEPVLRRVYNLIGRIVDSSGRVWLMSYGVFVRKCAHFTEYFMLGAACAGITAALAGRIASPYLWADLFAVLMVAVLDEFIQSFSDRTSQLADVLLDFFGGLVGFTVAIVIAAAVYAIVARRRT